jgi:AbrB family looped-hinge helix DNA binding protein
MKVDQEEKDECCSTPADSTCCTVEALVSVDERGQMVLPKELREKANIRPGDKLAVTSWEKDGKVCCISLTRAEELTEVVKATLGPVMKDIL